MENINNYSFNNMIIDTKSNKFLIIKYNMDINFIYYTLYNFNMSNHHISNMFYHINHINNPK